MEHITRNVAAEAGLSARRWWSAPLAFSIPGVLILLLWEYRVFRGDDFTAPIEYMIWLEMALFAIAWAPPWRPSVQWLRLSVATLGFGARFAHGAADSGDGLGLTLAPGPKLSPGRTVSGGWEAAEHG